MNAYSGRVGPPAPGEPVDPGEMSYPDETAKSNDALAKFTKVADKYGSTNPGRLARYYAALCLENLDKQNQALEELKKISSGGDKELASMAQYQMAVIYARTGKTDDAVKLFRALADKPSPVCAPAPCTTGIGGAVLRQTNPKEAANVYQQAGGFPGFHDCRAGRSRPGHDSAKIVNTLCPRVAGRGESFQCARFSADARS